MASLDVCMCVDLNPPNPNQPQQVNVWVKDIQRVTRLAGTTPFPDTALEEVRWIYGWMDGWMDGHIGQTEPTAF